MAQLPTRGDRIVTILQENDEELTCAELCMKLAYQECADIENENSKKFYAKQKAKSMSASVSSQLYRMSKSNVIILSESKGIKGGNKYKLNTINHEILDI